MRYASVLVIVAAAFDDALERATEDEEIGGIDIGREAGRDPLEKLALGIRRDLEDAEDPALEQCLLRFGESRVARTATEMASSASRALISRRLSSVRSSSTTAIGSLRTSLAEIGLRIEDAVEQRGDDHQADHAAVGEHAAPLADEGAADAAAGRRDDRRRCLLGRTGCRRGASATATRRGAKEAAPSPARMAKGRAEACTGAPRAA